MRSSSATFTLEFETLLNEPHPIFERVIQHSSFMQFWRQENPKLISFFIKNFSKFFNGAFIQSQTVPSITKICSQAFLESSQGIREKMFDHTPFFASFKSLTNDFSKLTFQAQKTFYELLLKILIIDNNVISEFYDQPFWIAILNTLEYEPTNQFMCHIFMRSEKPIKKLFSTISMDEICFKFTLSSNLFIRHRAQKIFSIGLGSNLFPNPSGVMLSNNYLNSLLQMGYLDYKSIDFIQVIFNHSCQVYRGNWKEIFQIISHELFNLCGKFEKFSLYTQNTDSVVSLTLSIIEANGSYSPFEISYIYNFTEKLCYLFFTNKHNSSLHNAFLRQIRILKSKKLLTKEILQRLELFQEILDCYSNREKEVQACYWGQLRLISEIIDAYASKCRAPQPDWKNHMKQIYSDEKIISAPYGGSIPKKNKVNSCDKTLLSICIIGLIIAIVIGFVPH